MDSTAPPGVINRAATDYDDASLNVGKLIAADSVTSGGNAVLTVAKTSWIRNLFSASGGGLSYNNSTGAFTDSDISAAQIKGLVSGLARSSTYYLVLVKLERGNRWSFIRCILIDSIQVLDHSLSYDSSTVN
jgi:hypothetical protein